MDFNNGFREIEYVLSSLRGGSYFGIFLLSVFVSFFVPLPEAVALLIFGYLGAQAQLNIVLIFLVCFAGIVLGNNIIYRLTFFGNHWVERFNKKMRQHKLIKYENLVADNIYKAIYFLRLIAGIRFFGPVISGSLCISWRKFFLADLGATFIHTILFVSLGYFFHNRIISLIAEVEIVKNILLFFSAVIAGFLLKTFSKK